jgi:hypothetical protein
VWIQVFLCLFFLGPILVCDLIHNLISSFLKERKKTISFDSFFLLLHNDVTNAKYLLTLMVNHFRKIMICHILLDLSFKNIFSSSRLKPETLLKIFKLRFSRFSFFFCSLVFSFLSGSIVCSPSSKDLFPLKNRAYSFSLVLLWMILHIVNGGRYYPSHPLDRHPPSKAKALPLYYIIFYPFWEFYFLGLT